LRQTLTNTTNLDDQGMQWKTKTFMLEHIDYIWGLITQTFINKVCKAIYLLEDSENPS